MVLPIIEAKSAPNAISEHTNFKIFLRDEWIVVSKYLCVQIMKDYHFGSMLGHFSGLQFYKAFNKKIVVGWNVHGCCEIL